MFHALNKEQNKENVYLYYPVKTNFYSFTSFLMYIYWYLDILYHHW